MRTDDRTHAEIEQHAALRLKRNQASPTNAGIERDADEKGIAGELAFVVWAGLDRGLIQSKKKTPGYHFTVNGIKIRTHCSDTPKTLMEKAGRLKADIYILINYTAKKNAILVGWATRAEMAAKEPKNYAQSGRYQLVAHGVPREELHKDFDELKTVLGIGATQLDMFGNEVKNDLAKRDWTN